jgi:serine/threonine protein kinase
LNDEDDARTVIKPTAGSDGLPVGHQVQEFVIEGVVGEGGFSLVYRARDLQLKRSVALKEYLPSALAARGAGWMVLPRTQRHRETFDLGLRSFVNEARLLASFEHPALVRVYRFWEENGTAYMVMPLYRGPTLKSWLTRHGPAEEPWLRAFLSPLLDALGVMHADDCYHRDVAPDNILLLGEEQEELVAPSTVQPNPKPVLLDLGAARRVLGGAEQALTVILKPGYAPIEQYTETSHLKQGPWTDIYALSAVIYRAIGGTHLPAAVARLVHDDMVSPLVVGQRRYSESFLRAVQQGLAIQPGQRPQSVAEFRALLFAGAGVPGPLPGPAMAQSSNAGNNAPTAAVLSSAGHAPPRRAVAARTGIGVLTLAVGGLGAWWWLGTSTPEVPSPSQRAPAAAAQVAVAPPAAASTPVSVPTSPSAGPAAPAASIPAAPAPAPSPPPASTQVERNTANFSVNRALEDIVAGAVRPGLLAHADKKALAIGSDRLSFRVQSPMAGFVYVFTGGTDQAHFYLLFPNGIDSRNRIEAGQEIVLPRPRWQITAAGPPGVNQLVVVVSAVPRDMSGAALRQAKGGLPEFDLARAPKVWAEHAGPQSPFLGTAVCKPGTAACDPSYAAVLLEVTEHQPAKRR